MYVPNCSMGCTGARGYKMSTEGADADHQAVVLVHTVEVERQIPSLSHLQAPLHWIHFDNVKSPSFFAYDIH